MHAPVGITSRPDVRHYVDYRAFLRDMYAHLKQVDSRFSYRVFSRRAGLSSPNYLKLVAEGQRNLSPESASKFARGLGLQRKEARIFALLVELAVAQTDDARSALLARVNRAAADHPAAQRRQDALALDESWVPRAVHALAGTPGFDPTPGAVAKRLRPPVRPGEAKRALELLRRAGLLDAGSAAPEDIDIPEVSGLRRRSRLRAHLNRATVTLSDPVDDGLVLGEVATLTLSPEGVARARAAAAAFKAELEAIAREDAAGRNGDAALYAYTCVLDRASNEG